MDNIKYSENIIGSVDCNNIEQTAGTLMNLLATMGMANPTTPTNTSTKAVSIKKKGNTFTLTIGLFTPPLTFTWTGLTPQSNLIEILSEIIANNKKISCINTVKFASGQKLVQFGLAS